MTQEHSPLPWGLMARTGASQELPTSAVDGENITVWFGLPYMGTVGLKSETIPLVVVKKTKPAGEK